MKNKFLLLTIVLLMVISVNAQREAVQVPAEILPFVEKKSKPIALESADLNGDGMKDFILVLERENPKTDGDDFPENQRPLLILLRGKDKKLTEAKRSERTVMCSQCGGVFGDPFEGVTVGAKTFTVNHYGGSNWRWVNHYKFNYSRIDKTWQLVRVEQLSYHTSDPDKVETKILLPKQFGKVDIADFDPNDFNDQ